MSESITPSELSIYMRELKPADYGSMGTLLDQAFIPKGGSHYFDDFPIWKSESSTEIKRLGFFDSSDNLVATASARIAMVRIVGIPERTKIAIIGAVATAPAARGQKLASKLVTELSNWAESRDAWMSVLWASQYEMYNRLGFELFGQQHRLPLSDLPFITNHMEVPIHHGWNPNLMRHFLIRTEGIVHSAMDEGWISAHKNVQWVWSGDPERPSAFLAYNRGIDLPGMIHEWGGQRDAIKPLIATVAKAQPALQLLFHPCHKWILDLSQYEITSEHLGMVKVYDRMRSNGLFRQFQSLPYAEWVNVVLGSPESQAFFPVWFWGLDCA